MVTFRSKEFTTVSGLIRLYSYVFKTGETYRFITRQNHHASLVTSNDYLYFNVKSCGTEAKVLLSVDPEQTAYRIVMGEDSNTRVSIYKGSDLVESTVATDFLSCQEFRTFHLSWSGDLVSLAQSSQDGDIVIIEYTDAEKIENLQFLVFESASHQHAVEWLIKQDAGR